MVTYPDMTSVSGDLYDIAYQWGWNTPELRSLVYLCYKTPDIIDNARRFYQSLEFQESVKVLSELGKKPDKNLKLLDFGCGNGIASYALSRAGYSVIGLDSSIGELAGINAAKKIQNLDGVNFELVHSTGETLNFSDETFDLIWLRETLHHIKGLEGFLKELKRILKPSGIICCLREHVIWNEEQRRHFYETHPFYPITKDEGCFYLEEYISAFKKAGLVLEKILDSCSSLINTYPSSIVKGQVFDENVAKKRQKGNDPFSFFARKPDDFVIYREKAINYLNTGKSLEALETFSKIRTRKHIDPIVEYGCAIALARMNRLDDSISTLENINVSPCYAQNLLSALRLQKDFSDKPEACLSKLKMLFNKTEECPHVLVLGDSVMERISYHDINKTTLRDMIVNNLSVKYKADYITYAGYNAGVFYCIINVLKALKNYPKTIILPINMRSFSPCWAFHPFHHKVNTILEIKYFLNKEGYELGDIYNIDKQITYDDFFSIEAKYPLTELRYISQFEQIINSNSENENERDRRYREIFIYHYLNKIDEDNRIFLLLKKTFQLINNLNINVITYITPINYQGGEKYVGEKFTDLVLDNVNIIKNYFSSIKKENLIFSDYSLLFDSEYFVHKNDTAEHLNQNGRLLLSRLITSYL